MRRWRRRSLRETPSKRRQRRTLRPTRPRTARSDADRVTRRQRRKITRPPPENIRRVRTQSAEASHTGTTRNQRTPSAQFAERGCLSEASQSDAGTSYKKKQIMQLESKRWLTVSWPNLSTTYLQCLTSSSGCNSAVRLWQRITTTITTPQPRPKKDARYTSVHYTLRSRKKTKLPFSTR